MVQRGSSNDTNLKVERDSKTYLNAQVHHDNNDTAAE
jgi:hypothetical protein